MWSEFILSPKATEALELWRNRRLTSAEEVSLLKKLRQSFSLSEASLLLKQIKLRYKAKDKFPQADRMFFEQEALEQSTSWPLALHRAQKLHEIAPPGPILDLGCGLGGDALALAQFREVIAIDCVEDRLKLLKANFQNLTPPHSIQTILADYTTIELPPAAAIFADPARRTDSRRVFNSEELSPPLTTILNIINKNNCPAAVKLYPSFDKNFLQDHLKSYLEFVGQHKQCQEAVLWLNTEATYRLEATVYNGGEYFTRRVVAISERPVDVGEVSSGQYLYEIEPAMLRAGVLFDLAQELHAHLFDPQVSWLIGESYTPTSLASTFQIEAVEKFSLKKLQKILREEDVGILEIKKRNFAVEPETIRKQIKLNKKSHREKTVFLTRIRQEPIFFIAQRI